MFWLSVHSVEGGCCCSQSAICHENCHSYEGSYKTEFLKKGGFVIVIIFLFSNYTGKKPDAVNFWLGESAAVTSCMYPMAM